MDPDKHVYWSFFAKIVNGFQKNGLWIDAVKNGSAVTLVLFILFLQLRASTSYMFD